MADEDDKKEKNEALEAEKPAEKEAETEEKTAEKSQNGEEKAEKSEKSTSGIGVLTWIILAVIIAVLAGSGFMLGRLFAGPETTESPQENQSDQPEDLTPDNPAEQSDKTWYYDLPAAVANLDEPGVTRYIRVGVTLEISPEVARKKGESFIKEKTPVLTSWLTIYLAGLTLEDTRGDRNLKRIQSQILDAFNERLFPDAKPQIKHILFREFAIQ